MAENKEDTKLPAISPEAFSQMFTGSGSATHMIDQMQYSAQSPPKLAPEMIMIADAFFGEEGIPSIMGLQEHPLGWGWKWGRKKFAQLKAKWLANRDLFTEHDLQLVYLIGYKFTIGKKNFAFGHSKMGGEWAEALWKMPSNFKLNASHGVNEMNGNMAQQNQSMVAANNFSDGVRKPSGKPIAIPKNDQ